MGVEYITDQEMIEIQESKIFELESQLKEANEKIDKLTKCTSDVGCKLWQKMHPVSNYLCQGCKNRELLKTKD